MESNFPSVFIKGHGIYIYIYKKKQPAKKKGDPISTKLIKMIRILEAN